MVDPPGYASAPLRGVFCKPGSPRLLWPWPPHALRHRKRLPTVLLNHFVGGRFRRDTDAERLGSLEIDNRLEPDRLVVRQIGARQQL